MKKHTFLFLTAALCLTVFSCAKTEAPEDSSSISGGSSEQQVEPSVPEEVPEGYIRVRLNAGTESAKTTISEGAGTNRVVNWAAGDEIKVLYAGGSTETEAETAGKTSTMTFDVPKGTETVYMVYPKAASSSLSESTLSVTIPAEQDGTFATANYAIARTGVSGGTAQFYNASALIQIDLTDATLTKAVITGANGEALVGTVPFTFGESSVTPGAASSTSTQLTVNFSGAKTYYVATLPGLSLKNGFSVKFYRGDEPAGGWKTTSATTIARAKIASLGQLDKAACFRYVTVSGAGTKSGRSWANAWGRDELKAFLVNTSSAYTASDLALMDGVTFLMGAGTYVIPDSSGEYPTMNYSSVTSSELTFSFKGGYPAAGGSSANPSTNVTILSGGEKGGVLKVTQKNHLSFDGFTITKARTSGGGNAALIINNDGSVALSNCNFTDNVNVSTCGALYIGGGNQFTVSSCTFDANTATYAAAFNMGYSQTSGTFSNCTFSNNATSASSGWGGAMKLEHGTVTFEDCTFTGNHTVTSGEGINTNGGAIWLTNSVNATFEDCQFQGNQSYDCGGAVFGNTGFRASFEDCVFGGNAVGDPNTAGSGGAIAMGVGTMTITNCTFEGNECRDFGGAIFTYCAAASGSLTISGSSASYKSNTAGQEGGVLYMQDGASVSIDGGVFDDNHANNGGVIGIRGASTLSICNTEMKNNSATNAMGGVILISDSPTVNLGVSGVSKGNNIHDNSAPTAGGAIAVLGSGGTTSTANTPNINIYSGNTFKANHANYGGAIKLRNQSEVATSGGTTGNETKANLTISGSNILFESNYASSGNGGALDLHTSGTVSITGATFSTNYINTNANVRGGAVHCSNGGFDATGNVNISECVFNGNYAIKVNSGDSYNSPKGGAFNVQGGLTTKINKCVFKNNAATQGGALSVNSGTTYLNDCIFTGNYISFRYGTTFYMNWGTICMNNCSVADNTYSTEASYGKQCCWAQIKANKLVMSNCSLIGRTRKDGDSKITGSDSCLLRFEIYDNSTTQNLINNIIATEGDCKSILIDGNATFNLISNKIKSKTIGGSSVVNTSGVQSEGFSGDKDDSSCFGSLAWTAGSTPAWNNCYWGWNGTLSGGSNTNKASLSDIKTAINTADSGFYTWLNGLGALDQDCRGHARSSSTWPGAYNN